MEQHGFIHDMLDVKVLLLFLMSRIEYPADVATIYELAYQDDCVSYFDVAQALPQMVETGHLICSAKAEYAITPKGIETGKVTDDSLAFPVRQRVRAAVERYNRSRQREGHIHIQMHDKADGQVAVVLGVDDETGSLMTLELSAPNQKQARVLAKAFDERAEYIYQMIVSALLEVPEDADA